MNAAWLVGALVTISAAVMEAVLAMTGTKISPGLWAVWMGIVVLWVISASLWRAAALRKGNRP